MCCLETQKPIFFFIYNLILQNIFINSFIMKLIIRIFLFPCILIYGLLFSSILLLPPFCMLIVYHFIQLIFYPFKLLLNYNGANLNIEEAFINETSSQALNLFLTFTLPVWLPFYITITYIKTGKVFTGE